MTRPALLGQLAWSTVAALAQFAGQVAFTALLLAVLGDEPTADTLSVLWIGLLLAVLGGLGLPEAGIRFVAVLRAHRRLAQAADLEQRLGRLQLLISSLLALVAGAVGWALDGSDLALLVACCVLAAATEQRGVARSHGSGGFQALALARFAFHGLRVAGLLLLLQLGGGVVAVAILILLSALVYPLLVRPLRGIQPLPVRPELQRFAYRYALGIWGATLIATLAWTRVELLVLELRSSPHQTVLFGIALSLAGIVLFVPGVISAPLLPYVAGRRRSQRADLQRIYHLALAVGLYASLLMLVVVVAFTPWFLAVAYGPDYADARMPTYLVGLAALGGIGGVISSVVHAHGRSHVHATITLLAALVLLLGAWLVAPGGGAEAVSQLRLVVFLGYTAILAAYVGLRLGLGFPLRALGLLLLTALLIGSGLLGWQAQVPAATLAVALAQAFLAVLGLLGFGLLLRPLDASAPETVLGIGGSSSAARAVARVVGLFSARRG